MLSAEDREALRVVGCSRHQDGTEYFICRPCAEAEVALVEAIVERQVAEARAEAWDQGVHAAFRGAITRQNAEDVKRTNPYRAACTCPEDEFLTTSDCALHGSRSVNQFQHSNGEELGTPDNLRADLEAGDV